MSAEPQPVGYPLGEALWKLAVQFVPYLAGLSPAAVALLGAIIIPALDTVARHFIGGLVAAQVLTMAQGWHYEFDPSNPARPPRMIGPDGKPYGGR